MPETSWTFEPVNPNASGASGKISDLFRNEELDQPGHLARDAPGASATLMAREVIQNSWDAARELSENESDVPPFELDFTFQRAFGDGKQRLVRALALRDLANHAARAANSVEERAKVLGLAEGDCLQSLGSDEPLDYYEIVERGASGMYGPWQGAESHMYLAMASIGYTEKPDGSGGTFGYGKAGLIRASRVRVVLAYSCFREREDDPGVTRRLLGMAYWGRHKAGEQTLNGFARFGNPLGDGTVAPYENEAADSVAEALGLEVRDASITAQLGTTFVVLDPVVEPDALRVAVERNWWPALLEDSFTVLIRDADGKELHCRPRANPDLASFIEAYDIVKSGSVPGDGHKGMLRGLGHYQPVGGQNLPLGQLALVADPDGWSFPDEVGGDEASDFDSRSLVALMRDPRMVVEYHLPGRDIARRVPYVRGVFVATHEVNAELARTEPKAHDKWDVRESEDVPVAATKYAKTISDRIRSAVRGFQDELRPPIDESSAVRLHRLDEKLAKLRNQQGKNPPPPPPGDRPFRFTLDVRREQRGQELVVVGHVDVWLADDVAADELPSRLRIALAIDEDGKRGSEIPLRIVPPAGFVQVEGDPSRFDGRVRRTSVRFDLESDPYRADWTGELLVSGEELREEEEEAA